MTEKDFFSANWLSVVEILIQSISKIKEKALELIELLISVYLVRVVDKFESEKLQSIALQIFSKKNFQSQTECFNAYVDIIVTIARSRMEFAMHNVIFELLSTEQIVVE